MVKEESPANLGTGVNFHPGNETIHVGNESTEEVKLALPQKMGQAVKPESMQARVKQYNLQPASGCWISGEDCADIFSQQFKHSHCPCPLAKIP
jgi:hypothetical protein